MVNYAYSYRGEETPHFLPSLPSQASTDTNEFFLLHGVTSAWSLCQVVEHLEAADAVEALFYFVNALLAVFVVVGSPDLDLSRLQEDEDIKWV